MERFLKIYNNIEKTVGQCVYVVLTVIVFAQTVLRYFFHHSLSWPEEISSYLLVWLVYFTAAYAAKEDAHMRIDSVVKLWPGKSVKYARIAGNLLLLALGAYLVYYGTLYTAQYFQLPSRSSTVAWLQMWVIYIAIPLGHLFIILRIIEKLITQIKELKGGESK